MSDAGHITGRRRRGNAARVALGLVAAALTIEARPAPVAAKAPLDAEAKGDITGYAKPISRKLNPTGKPINMAVPLKEDKTAIGEIVVVINPDDTVLLPKAALVDKMTKSLDQASMQRLHGIQERNGQISVSDLTAAGFNVKFDPGQLELVFLPNADQRPVGDLSLSRGGGPGVSANAQRPALFSAYLNAFAGADYSWGNQTGNDTLSPSVNLEAVARIFDIVLENDLVLEGGTDTFTCPVQARCVYDHLAGVKRRRSRLTYDLPDYELRVQGGDVDVYGTGFQRAPDVLGITVEKSPRKLRPGESIRPTGQSSFRIERPSDVEVMVNGAVIQRLRLRSGNYNLSDLPLATGANEVQLVITDDTGERRTLAFTTFFDGNLMKPGKVEWALSGGVPSYFEDNERRYRSSEVFGSGFVRYGLTNEATGEAGFQGDNTVLMGSLGMFTATPWGFLGVRAAGSDASGKLGYAADVTYDLVNFKGPFGYVFADALNHESLRLGAEYRHSDFHVPGEFLTTAGGVLLPQYNYWLRLSASYSTPLWDRTTASLSGRYQFADDTRAELSSYTLRGDRYGGDLTLSRPITDIVNASVTFGYSNESYLVSDTSHGNGADYRVMARLYVRPTEETRVSASYDSLNKETYVSGYYGTGRGLDRWETTVDVQHSGRDNRANAGSALSYVGNRGEVRVTHATGFSGASINSFDVTPTDQRTGFRVGTGIVFADGAIGIGQPIRGNGFAIVEPHESISDKTVSVGTGEDIRAKSGWFGPAVVSDVPAYTNASIPVDVADLPVGYSLGSGTFDTHAPYRAGYRLKVGSGYSVSAFGTLLKDNGEPVALLTGVAQPVGDATKQVAVFTNSAGKFGAEGLAPGKWTITMATDGAPTVFEVTIPEGTSGLFKAGELRPAKKG